MIHYYYGDGKGKTTAAMGLAIRALGRGQRVHIVQFLKNAPSGEAMLLETLPGVQLSRGTGSSKFIFQMTTEEKEEMARIQINNLRQGCDAVKEDACDLLVLDEVGDAASLGFVNMQELKQFLKAFGSRIEIVMTGHSAVLPLIELADYVTEMQKQKHPYDQGVAARIGVEK